MVNYAKIRKAAKIRNRYNQVPHLTQDITWKRENTRDGFNGRRVVDLMKTAKVNASCIYLERLSFYLYMQLKIISKCIT